MLAGNHMFPGGSPFIPGPMTYDGRPHSNSGNLNEKNKFNQMKFPPSFNPRDAMSSPFLMGPPPFTHEKSKNDDNFNSKED